MTSHDNYPPGQTMLTRRDTILALAAAAFAAGDAFAAPARPVAGTAFSWETLQALATRMADQPWRARDAVAAAKLLDFDAVNRIGYRADKAIWRGQGDSEIRLFPLQMYAAAPVDIATVENGVARPFAFAPDLFTIAPDAKRPSRPRDFPQRASGSNAEAAARAGGSATRSRKT